MSFGYEAKCHKVSQALFKFNQGSGYVYSLVDYRWPGRALPRSMVALLSVCAGRVASSWLTADANKVRRLNVATRLLTGARPASSLRPLCF